jgi:hypothetical protein
MQNTNCASHDNKFEGKYTNYIRHLLEDIWTNNFSVTKIKKEQNTDFKIFRNKSKIQIIYIG